MKSFFRYSGVLFVALCLALPLAAAPITYTMTGSLSGTLGTDPVTLAAFTFVFNGDTTNITGTDPLLNPAISNSILITGFGSGQFSQAIDVGVSPIYGIGGFTDATASQGIQFENGVFVGWDLATPIGPLTSSSPAFASGAFTTSLDTLTISSAQDLTFQATTVPEPATFALTGLALICMAGFWKSRAKR
jgi:hypothetical protein